MGGISNARLSREVAPALLNKRGAAAYLNCSVAHFDETIRPHVPHINLAAPTSHTKMLRWRKTDLDAWITGRLRGAA